MSNEWDDGTEEYPVEQDQYEQQESQGMAQLRKAFERQKKQNDEFKTQLAQYQARDRERTLSDVLSSKGLNGKLAKFYPVDQETSEEKVASWLKDNEDVFGIQSAEPTPQPQVSDELRNVYEQFQHQSGNEAPSQDVLSAINNYQFGDPRGDVEVEMQKFMQFMRNNPNMVHNPTG